MTNAVGADRLRQIVARIESVQAGIDDLNTDKSEIYGEAKGAGFDIKVLKKVVRDRRLDRAERQEQDALYDLYMGALEGSGTPVATRVHARDARSAAAGPAAVEPGEAGAARAPSPASDPPAPAASAKVRRAAKKFVDAVAKNPGDSVTIQSAHAGVRIENVDGRKVVSEVAGLSPF